MTEADKVADPTTQYILSGQTLLGRSAPVFLVYFQSIHRPRSILLKPTTCRRCTASVNDYHSPPPEEEVAEVAASAAMKAAC